MLHPSTKKLIDRLAEMTELGKLDWTEGENGDLVYSTEGYSVCLPDGGREVVIHSIEGKELERAAADALAGTMTDAGTPYAQIVAEMGAEAGRIARGTETAISSLLAGMEEPAAPAESDPTESMDEGPEDPGDESAPMMSDSVDEQEAPTEIETTPEPDAEPETELAAAADEAEVVEADDAHAEVEDSEPIDEPEIVADSSGDDLSLEAPMEAEAGEVDTESQVTEAVARLADEVNNRDALTEPAAESELTETSAEEEEAPSALGMAAATAVGVVATAAGLDQDDSSEIVPETITTETSLEPEPEASASTAIDASPPTYVPFGLEDSDETPAPVEAPASEPALEDTISSASIDEEVASFATFTPEAEAEPEATFSAESDEATDEPVVEMTAPIDEAMSEPESTEEAPQTDATFSNEAEPMSEAPETTSEPQLDTAPETESSPLVEAEPEPEIAAETVVADTAPDATEIAEESSIEPAGEDASEVEEEPVLATATEPQSYSLSGIGAGFGLGALAAKTEASGIPGPSAAPAATPEKIVIDATEDVLPELEGNLNVERMEAAVSEINFGAKQNGDPSEDGQTEEDADGDILKPRTRFNPWD
nr:hypothetical protein [Hyphomonas sp. Mor2]